MLLAVLVVTVILVVWLSAQHAGGSATVAAEVARDEPKLLYNTKNGEWLARFHYNLIMLRADIKAKELVRGATQEGQKIMLRAHKEVNESLSEIDGITAAKVAKMESDASAKSLRMMDGKKAGTEEHAQADELVRRLEQDATNDVRLMEATDKLMKEQARMRIIRDATVKVVDSDVAAKLSATTMAMTALDEAHNRLRSTAITAKESDLVSIATALESFWHTAFKKSCAWMEQNAQTVLDALYDAVDAAVLDTDMREFEVLVLGKLMGESVGFNAGVIDRLTKARVLVLALLARPDMIDDSAAARVAEHVGRLTVDICAEDRDVKSELRDARDGETVADRDLYGSALKGVSLG
jgi:hypothetical protein